MVDCTFSLKTRLSLISLLQPLRRREPPRHCKYKIRRFVCLFARGPLRAERKKRCPIDGVWSKTVFHLFVGMIRELSKWLNINENKNLFWFPQNYIEYFLENSYFKRVGRLQKIWLYKEDKARFEPTKLSAHESEEQIFYDKLKLLNFSGFFPDGLECFVFLF